VLVVRECLTTLMEQNCMWCALVSEMFHSLLFTVTGTNFSVPSFNLSIFWHWLWNEILSQQRIKHFKILQSIYFAYEVGIISSYSNTLVVRLKIKLW